MDNHEESVRRWRAGAIISGIITALLLVVMALWGVSLPTADDGPIGDVPDDIRALIADPPEYDCMASVTEYELPTEEVDGETKVVLTYIPNEVGTEEDERDFSNSVNVSAIPVERDRVLASVCSQPEQAGMVGFALANKSIFGNEKSVDLNPDLFGQFIDTTPKEWADKVLSGEISYTEATETMTQLAGLMTIFEVTEETRTTEWNFHALDAISKEANVRPIVENDVEYTGDFLVFSLTRKSEDRCWSSFGINVGLNGDYTKGDQRIAGFTCDEPTPTPTPTTPSEEPECTKDCGGDGKTGRWKGGDGIDVDAGEYTGETAPDVVTEEESSEGIVDNANQTPGSETGGQAGGGATSHGDGGRGDTGEVQDDLNGDDDDGSSDTVVTNPFG